MEFPADLKYTKEHEWCRVEGDTVVIGVTAYAQEQLGDIVFVDLPDEGREVAHEEAFAALESTKAVSDVYAPIAGVIVEANTPLADSPETINEDPYGDGWLVRVKPSDPAELNELMTAAQYEKYVKEQQDE